MALDRRAVPPAPVLFRLTGLPRLVRDVYHAAAEFCECRDLDWAMEVPGSPVPNARSFDKILDLRDFAFDPAFRGVAMIDFFLGRLGLAPASVAPARRRNAWLAPRITLPPPRLAEPYVLVCPRASMRLRDMPAPAHAAVLAVLRERGITAATQGEAGRLDGGAVAVAEAGSLAELCGWVAGAALVVSTDTAMVHLADAFGVPCIAVFTTHRPEWRVRDYPLCRPLYRPVAGLPPALEFARGPEDVAAAHAAWLDADGARWLTDAVAEGVQHVRPRGA